MAIKYITVKRPIVRGNYPGWYYKHFSHFVLKKLSHFVITYRRTVGFSVILNYGRQWSISFFLRYFQGKKWPVEIDRARIVEQDGEYGYFKNEKFTTVSNFILRCEGVVKEDGDVVGFILRAKPKNDINSEADGW